MVDRHRAVEAEILGPAQVGAHLGERRGARAEGEAGEAEAELDGAGCRPRRGA